MQYAISAINGSADSLQTPYHEALNKKGKLRGDEEEDEQLESDASRMIIDLFQRPSVRSQTLMAT
jgi:hypothetical protein